MYGTTAMIDHSSVMKRFACYKEHKRSDSERVRRIDAMKEATLPMAERRIYKERFYIDLPKKQR